MHYLIDFLLVIIFGVIFGAYIGDGIIKRDIIEEPETLKIEEGKFYKTRAGEKAICVYVDKTKICRMVIVGSCVLDYYWVKQTGECYESFDPPYDIVAEQGVEVEEVEL